MSATSYRHSCRACLGGGCVHCGGNGTVRERVFRRPDVEAASIRALLLTDREVADVRAAARVETNRRALA